MKNERLLLLAFAALITVFALWVRYSLWAYLPNWINVWIGDSLWSFMLYFAFLGLFGTKKPLQTAWILALVCFAIECSQLYQADWIKAIRATTLGGLAIGHGFLWSDLLAYTGGIIVAYYGYRTWVAPYFIRVR